MPPIPSAGAITVSHKAGLHRPSLARATSATTTPPPPGARHITQLLILKYDRHLTMKTLFGGGIGGEGFSIFPYCSSFHSNGIFPVSG
jgi:hypothetical protein